jgi:hypothetical protein
MNLQVSLSILLLRMMDTGGELPHFPSEPLAAAVQERLSAMKGNAIGTCNRLSADRNKSRPAFSPVKQADRADPPEIKPYGPSASRLTFVE